MDPTAGSSIPNAFDVALKDPGISRSDFWQFPTNRFATLGWLGRVHRGTPWQTVFLKSPGVDAAQWQQWTGNPNANDAVNTMPVKDRDLLDLFTTALNENATRGQLPINQTNLAAWSALFGGMVALSNSTPDAVLSQFPAGAGFDPWVIDPAGANSISPVARLVNAINDVRATNFNNAFTSLGQILAVPELSTNSPFLNLSSAVQLQSGLNDAVYEWLPQQILSLVRVGEPRFVIYSYGQALHPADRSVLTSGPFFGMCTNYQVTAEVVTRAVVRIEGAPNNPHAVIESYNVLPPD